MGLVGGLVGLAGKTAWKTTKEVWKATGRAILGAADAAGLEKLGGTRAGRHIARRLDPVRAGTQRGVRGISYHLSHGAVDLASAGAQAAILGLRGLGAATTRPTRPGEQGNLFNRELKPWAVASLAFLTLSQGLNTANQITAASSVEYNPRTDPTMLDNYDMEYYKMRTKNRENPILMQDASHNYTNMGATGDLTLALHKNRHG